MSNDAMCAKCGGTNFHRQIDVTVDGWRGLTVTYEDDGSLSYTEGYLEREGVIDETPGDFVCSDCGVTKRKLEDLVARADTVETVCCCGHGLGLHKEQKFDRRLYTRGRRPCTTPACGCFEFETDPALATVVREMVA